MMKNNDFIVDAEQRRLAIDPTRSFIVQAPAGSGKTELLTRRFLALLSTVSEPEEIIAITFTKKAAAEMRTRIIEALNQARDHAMPEQSHQAERWLLAQAVVKRDNFLDWKLSSNPNRLQILTIDALCTTLTRQMPVLSEFGAQPEVSDDTLPMYREAARNLLNRLNDGEIWAHSVEILVRHLDNNWPAIEELLIDMLGRRDQWLRHVIAAKTTPELRSQLETGLQRIIRQTLHDLNHAIPTDIVEELIALMKFASINLMQEKADCVTQFWLDASMLPDPDIYHLPVWLTLTDLFLTVSNTWRASVNKNNGFPSGKTSAPMKDLFSSISNRLQSCDGLQQLFLRLRLLPTSTYTEDQWRLIEAFLRLLPLAVAELKLVFKANGQVDFTEIAQAAVQALGHHDAPTSLALRLDYRIHHLLVDEFQDTSFSQYELLEKLTAGWQSDDGRTLFIVGDPMQSIYRFREANVGLFLWAREHGLTNVQLIPLTLQVNFRSATSIVTWVNHAFAAILPKREDITTGAVCYSPSVAFDENNSGTGIVTVHPSIGYDLLQEANHIVNIIKATKADNNNSTIAVLVRARRHLSHIVAALNKEKLAFTALEIAPLAQQPVIYDLWALTRALIHPADRVAWIAVLRAPWCGLSLTDIFTLLNGRLQQCVGQVLLEKIAVDAISENGWVRLFHLQETLSPYIEQRRRLTLRQLVEGAWTALGGPACLTNEGELNNANVYFDLLDKIDSGGDLFRLDLLDEKIQSLFAQPDPNADGTIQLMTVHKAKGLEFDVVIVPGLGQRSPQDRSRLLYWQELSTEYDTSDLILAPIKATNQNSDQISGYLMAIEKEKARNESARLLYVAATRAKKALHLFGHIADAAKSTNETTLPHSNSLLMQLWPVVKDQFLSITPTHRQSTNGYQESRSPQAIHRLPDEWMRPDPHTRLSIPPSRLPTKKLQPIEFIWASDTIRYVGILVHRWLKQITVEGVDYWTQDRIHGQEKSFLTSLISFGVPTNELVSAIDSVKTALCNTLNDPQGRWILTNHNDARCEWAVTGIVQGNIVNAVIDRTFIDKWGVRWIIDYKTGLHAGSNIEAFIEQEQQRYRPQLELYAGLLSPISQGSIKLGLYFPLLQAWKNWDYYPRTNKAEGPDPNREIFPFIKD